MKKIAIVITAIFAMGLMAGCATHTTKAPAKAMHHDVKGEHDYKGEARMK